MNLSLSSSDDDSSNIDLVSNESSLIAPAYSFDVTVIIV
jgi:hypothetical protein